jgi:hypothetical protein
MCAKDLRRLLTIQRFAPGVACGGGVIGVGVMWRVLGLFAIEVRMGFSGGYHQTNLILALPLATALCSLGKFEHIKSGSERA